MRFARVLPVIAGAFLLAAPAHAVVINIFSQGTALDSNEYNDFGGGPTDNVVIGKVGAWATPPAGSSWVSYGGAGVTGGITPTDGTIVTFTQLFTLPYDINSGSVMVWADDTAQVSLDGSVVWAFGPDTTDSACLNHPVSCEPGEGGFVDLSLLEAGQHTLTFEVQQLHGDGYGLLYAGSVESVPEPGTLMLLGAGIVALGARRRKRT